MEWELSKENVQPLKSGRNVEVLNDALKAKAEGPARSNTLEHQRR
jgi:checkpoint serine/threonine-protein kinase